MIQSYRESCDTKAKIKLASQPKTSKFIKERKEKILKHYTNCTVTSITTGRKREGGHDNFGVAITLFIRYSRMNRDE